MNNNGKNNKGLSLLEVMVAMMLLSVIMLPLVGMLLSSGSTDRLIQIKTVAAKACHAQMEILLSQSISLLTSGGAPYPQTGTNPSKFSGTFNIKGLPGMSGNNMGNVEITVVAQGNTITGKLLKIRVWCYTPNSNATILVQVIRYRYDGGGAND